MLPRDIVLIRHGQSEGNVANERSRRGDNSDFTDAFLARHSAGFRLTDKGREQAKRVGEWLRKNNLAQYDRYYVSEYTRAMETAALLNLPGAEWYADYQLRERDHGIMDIIRADMANSERFAEYHRHRQIHAFYAPFPGGESMANLCDRLRGNIIATLHRECGDKRVIIVSHGDVMRGLRVILERTSADQYHAVYNEDAAHFKIGNGQIIHYTRVDPDDSTHILPVLGWVQSVNPWDPKYGGHNWRVIERERFTNERLLSLVETHPRTIGA